MKSLTIHLGSRCNAACEYCHCEKDGNLEPNVEALAARINELPEHSRVKFLGGEPLVYWDTIEYLQKKFRLKYQWSVGTNGILLDKYLDKLKRFQTQICISYDGSNSLRKMPVNWDILYQLPELWVSYTVMNTNCDVLKEMTFIDEISKEYVTPIWCIPHFMHALAPEHKTFVLTDGQLQQLITDCQMAIDHLITAVQTRVPMSKYFGIYLWVALKVYQNNFAFGETTCFNNELAKVNNQGEFVTCLYDQNPRLSMTNWSDVQQTEVSLHQPKCRTCLVYRYCGAACYKSKFSDHECQFYKTMITWFVRKYGHRPFIRLCQ